MWKISGLTHDLGYPFEVGHNIQEKFSGKMNQILNSLVSSSPRLQAETYPKNLEKLCGNASASELIQRRLLDWDLDLNVERYIDWLQKSHRVDHGLISAFAQTKVVDALYDVRNPMREERNVDIDGLGYNQAYFSQDVVSACSALFLHNIDLNYDGFKKKISFNKSPIAFLLFLCDTFQEWDRYTEKDPILSGCDFDIEVNEKSLELTVPESVEGKVSLALSTRLDGLTIWLNGKRVTGG